jgi:hypothetical protein
MLRPGLRVAVFVALLAVLYGLYLRWVITPNPPEHVLTLGGILLRLALLVFMGSVPFFVMAWLDPSWRSKHAAAVAALTWLAVFGAFSITLGAACPAAAAFFFIPFSAGALLGHNVGMFRHPETFDREELDR